MIIEEIQTTIYANQDIKYQKFMQKLIPTVPADSIIGVRTPILKKYAKTLIASESLPDFLSTLPHTYFEENQLHAFILSLEKNFDTLMPRLTDFLPYINNWATCDQLSPKIFKKHLPSLISYIESWINSDEPYTIRFGIGRLMQHYLEDAFDIRYPTLVAQIHSEEYYVNMMIAWYFATALSKQYEKILPFIEEKQLEKWTHNKTIQKAIESFRITPEQKEYLRTLRI